eukprot:1492839-Rhodomonas_salina.1
MSGELARSEGGAEYAGHEPVFGGGERRGARGAQRQMGMGTELGYGAKSRWCTVRAPVAMSTQIEYGARRRWVLRKGVVLAG